MSINSGRPGLALSWWPDVFKQRAAIFAVVGMTIVLAAVMGDVILNSDALPGTDTYFHLTLIDEAVERLKTGQPAGPIAESINGGRPYLYDTGTTYPYFSYWVSIGVSFIVGNVSLAYALLVSVALLGAQLSFFFAFKRQLGTVAATVGAVTFGYAPFLLTNVMPQGRFPAILAVSLTPLVMAGVLKTLERPSRCWWIAGLLATLVSASFHPMVFYMTAIGIGVIALPVVVATKVPPRRILLAATMIGLGVLVAWILLPSAITSLSVSNPLGQSLSTSAGPGIRSTTGGASTIVPFSIRLNSFDVGLRSFNENYAGLGLLLACLLAIAVTWRRKIVLFGLSAALIFLLSAGTATPLWNMLPLASQLEPRRFLFPAYLAMSLVIAFATAQLVVDFRRTSSLFAKFWPTSVLLIIVGLIMFDAVPMASRIAPEARGLENSWADVVEANSIDGRVFWNAGRDFAPYFFFSRNAGVQSVSRLADADLAIRQGFPETAVEQIALLDVRAVLTDETDFQDLVDELLAHDYSEVARNKTAVLLISENPSSRLMKPSRSVGLVGSAATNYWSRILPNSVPVNDVANMPSHFLDTFKAIVMSAYSAPNQSEIEMKLFEYVERGGAVIFEEPNTAGDGLFGVLAEAREVPEILHFVFQGESASSLPFSVNGDPYFGTFYDGAGEVVLSATDDAGNVLPLIQKRKMGEGAIYWVCCNLGNHVVVNPGRDFELAQLLHTFFESELGGYGEVWPAAFESQVDITGPSDTKFTYQSNEPTVAIVSARPVSQREVILDDEIEVKPLRYGDAYAVVLPAGNHKVSISTDAAPVTAVTLGIWLAAIASTVFVVRRLWPLLAQLPAGSTGFLPAIRNWLFEPPFVRQLETAGGTIRVCEPRTAERFDLKSASGGYTRLQPSLAGNTLAVLLVEVLADASMKLDLDQLVLVSAEGREFRSVAANQLRTQSANYPNPLHLLDVTSPILDPVIRLEASQSVRGYVLFEFRSIEEYPFVHERFVRTDSL